jgi:DNA-binding IclR family transcriptional regulator
MSVDDPYRVPGLVRGLAALQVFTPSRPELSLSELAAELGVTRSAAFRTVHTLVSEGYLLAVRDNRFRLGPSVLRLSYGYLASRELLEVAQGPLETLRDEIDWSTHLGVLDGRHVLYLLRLPATRGLSSLVHVGSRLPAATTAMGRIFLGQKSERQVRQLYSGDLDRGALERVLQTARADRDADHVQSIGRFESGISSVAAPVRDLSGQVVAAMSATNVTDVVPEAVVRAVTRSAAAISMGLGWRPDA